MTTNVDFHIIHILYGITRKIFRAPHVDKELQSFTIAIAPLACTHTHTPAKLSYKVP